MIKITIEEDGKVIKEIEGVVAGGFVMHEDDQKLAYPEAYICGNASYTELTACNNKVDALIYHEFFGQIDKVNDLNKEE